MVWDDGNNSSLPTAHNAVIGHDEKRGGLWRSKAKGISRSEFEAHGLGFNESEKGVPNMAHILQGTRKRKECAVHCNTVSMGIRMFSGVEQGLCIHVPLPDVFY